MTTKQLKRAWRYDTGYSAPECRESLKEWARRKRPADYREWMRRKRAIR